MQVASHSNRLATKAAPREDVALLAIIRSACSEDEKIRRFVELAVTNCGSASELANRVGVSAATVSAWRWGKKRPDGAHLIRIQEIAFKPSLLS
jgi:DNA-binding transcriptional regulator YiaG